MNIRQATRADNAALCALERRTALNIDGRPMFIDRKDFFEPHDLQGRSVVMLAEEDGEIIGVCAGALNQTMLAGQEHLLLYIHHERIAPEHQRKGIGGALTRACSDYWREHGADHIDSSYWHIAQGNQQSLNFATRSGNQPWPVTWSMLSFWGQYSGPAPARIGAGPTFDIVRLINRTHTGSDLFKRYEHVDFGQRLSRSRAYGWGHIYGRFDGDSRLAAVAGLWNGNVADFGYEEGAEEEMIALLRSLVPVSLGAGHQNLTIHLDARSALLPRLRALDHYEVELAFFAPRIEAPADPAPLYIDPAYF